jgi:hypothetical protein
MKKIKMRMLKAWGPFVPGQIVVFAESKAKWAIGDGIAEKYKISKAEIKAKAQAEKDAKDKAKKEAKDAKDKAEKEAKQKAEAETAMVEPVAETADVRPLGNKKKRGK